MFCHTRSTHSGDLGFPWGQKGSFTGFRPCQGHRLVQGSAVETLGGGWPGGGQLGQGGVEKGKGGVWTKVRGQEAADRIVYSGQPGDSGQLQRAGVPDSPAEEATRGLVVSWAMK